MLKLKRLESSLSEATEWGKHEMCRPGPTTIISNDQRISRSKVKPANWKLCIFCQEDLPKTHLIDVTTFKKSNEILEGSKFDYRLMIHLAGVSDLIAQEVEYHLHCYASFICLTKRTKDKIGQTDLPML